MKCNRHLVKAKKGVKFDCKRADWCTYQNFELKYQEVYQQMVESHIASKFDAPAWFDKSGNIVEEENEAFGWKSSYFVDRPDKLRNKLDKAEGVGTNNLLLLASSLPPLSPQHANELDDGTIEEV